MLMIGTLILLAGAAQVAGQAENIAPAPEAGKQTPSERGYCKGKLENGFCNDAVILYELLSNETNPVLLANCAVGSVLVIQLPRSESLQGEPMLGNSALFQSMVQQDPLQVTVWPTIPKGTKLSPDELLDEKSNIQINLKSGISILIQLRISNFESAVQRIVFRHPEREQLLDSRDKLKSEIRKEVEKEYQQIQENMNAEAHKRALSLMAQGIMQRAFCTGLREREMQDLLVVRADQICQVGDYVYIKLEIHNRAKDLFSMGNIEVLGMSKDKAQPLDAVFEWQESPKPQLRFDQRAVGVAMFPVTEESASSEYAVRVTESAGKKRVVTVGVEF